LSNGLNFWKATVLAAVVVVGVWAVASALGWTEEPVKDWIPAAPFGAATVIIGLLVADVLFPLPATILMAASGAALGPIVGTIVNGFGLLAATEVGRLLGRRAAGRSDETGAVVTGTAVAPAYVAATRGVPVLSEAVALAAGAAGASRRDVLLPAAIGSFVVGSIHAVMGSIARDDLTLASGAMMLLIAVIARASGQTRFGQ